MNRILPLLLFLCSFSRLFAQTTSVLDSKNVTWAGVACLAYPIDFPDTLDWAVGFYEATPVKVAADRYPDFHPTGFLANKLFADVWSGALPAFQLGAGPTRPLRTIWDSLALDQQRPLARADWNAWLGDATLTDARAASRLAGQVKTYRFKTFYFFDKRKRALQARVEGAVLELAGAGNDTTRLVCWIPFAQQQRDGKFSNRPETPDYVYVADLTRMVNFERDVVTLKGSVDALLREWVWQPLEKRRVKGYAFREDAVARQKPVKFKTYWKQYANRRDTVITFDPETYEERTTVVDQGIDAYSLRRASVQQRFFYDDRRKTLFAEVRMVSPAVPRYDADGNYRFDVPLVHVPLVKKN